MSSDLDLAIRFDDNDTLVIQSHDIQFLEDSADLITSYFEELHDN